MRPSCRLQEYDEAELSRPLAMLEYHMLSFGQTLTSGDMCALHV
jgi:hypothetical protein